VFLSSASGDSGNAERVGAFLEKFLEEHGHKLVSELPARTADFDFLAFARGTMSDLTWGDVRSAEVAVTSERPSADIAEELEGSKWGALVTVLKENGLNAGQIIQIVLAFITVIFVIQESLEPQPTHAPQPNVDVDVEVEVPTDEVVKRVIEELEKRERARRRAQDR
jgi:hypothetical protein